MRVWRDGGRRSSRAATVTAPSACIPVPSPVPSCFAGRLRYVFEPFSCPHKTATRDAGTIPAMPLDFAISALLTLFVVVDPVGLVPAFLVVTEGLPAAARRSVALRASMIGGAILIGAALLGDWLFRTLGISLSAFRIAGGLLLFSIASEMVFGVRVAPRKRGRGGSGRRARAQRRRLPAGDSADGRPRRHHRDRTPRRTRRRESAARRLAHCGRSVGRDRVLCGLFLARRGSSGCSVSPATSSSRACLACCSPRSPCNSWSTAFAPFSPDEAAQASAHSTLKFH